MSGGVDEEDNRSSSEAPIEALKRAHVKLTASYVQVHGEAADNRLLRPVVDGHLRRCVRSLHDAYLHAAETSFSEKRDRDWLVGKAGALQELESTFRARWAFSRLADGANLILGVSPVLGVLAATGVASGVIAILDGCFCQLVGIVPLIISVAIYFAFCDAFAEKRKLFLGTSAGARFGIYGTEDAVFKALKVEKGGERPFDLYGWLLISAVWILAIAVEKSVTEERHLVNPNRWLFWVALAFAVSMTTVTYYRHRTRIPS